jgi:hypothetical protein
MIDLQTLGGDSSGFSSAQGLNSHGQVVGDGTVPTSGPPYSGVHAILWQTAPSAADNITVSPSAAINNVGTSHTVTIAATGNGQPVQSAVILVNVSGSVSESGSCVTDSVGQCSFTYGGPLLPGADAITACADNNHSGTVDTGEPCGQATNAWVLPSSTTGQVTGGGQLASTSTGQVAFGFNAQAASQGIKGECTIADTRGSDTKVKCIDATALVRSANRATIFGNATVNGATTTYRIDVTDNGQPGAGQDTFTVHTASGYSVTGTITNGNIQVR